MTAPIANPVAGGSAFINQAPVIDPKTGKASPIFTKWFNDVSQRVANALDLLGQFTGYIAPTAHVAGRVEPIGTTLQNINASGEVAAGAITGVLPAAQIPPASLVAIGGIKAINTVPDQWIDAISAAGVPHTSQPGFGNLLGAATPGQLPNLNLINGAVTAAQVPNLSALNGQITGAQMPAGGATGTIHLAKLTGGGANGSITVVDGQITAFVDPT